jgi:hypothetical protein
VALSRWTREKKEKGELDYSCNEMNRYIALMVLHLCIPWIERERARERSDGEDGCV